MRLSLMTLLVGSLLASGCIHRSKGDPMAKPVPAPEMKHLERFIGTWSVTAEMVSPSAEELRKRMPDGQVAPTSFKGGSKAEWALGGMYLKQEGWHETGTGERENFVEYMKWDPRAGKIRSWWFSDRGQRGEGLFKVSDDGSTMQMKANGSDALGNSTRGTGTIHFTDDKTMEWSWTEHGPLGKMQLKGTSRKDR